MGINSNYWVLGGPVATAEMVSIRKQFEVSSWLKGKDLTAGQVVPRSDFQAAVS